MAISTNDVSHSRSDETGTTIYKKKASTVSSWGEIDETKRNAWRGRRSRRSVRHESRDQYVMKDTRISTSRALHSIYRGPPKKDNNRRALGLATGMTTAQLRRRPNRTCPYRISRTWPLVVVVLLFPPTRLIDRDSPSSSRAGPDDKAGRSLWRRLHNATAAGNNNNNNNTKKGSIS